MGTDIHGGFIKVAFENDKVVSKQAIKSNWKMDRNYTLFAILAGVRNGYGFAGSYRHEPLKPIAKGRGIPSFIELKEGDYTEDLYNQCYGCWDGENEFGEYLGDHSFTYMTIAEILNWEVWNNHLSQGGVVEVGHYHSTLAKGKEPEYWSGGISGGSVVVVSEQDLINEPEATHVKCYWQSEQTLGEMYNWFLEEVNRIKEEHGEDVYLVVGFDS